MHFDVTKKSIIIAPRSLARVNSSGRLPIVSHLQPQLRPAILSSEHTSRFISPSISSEDLSTWSPEP
ncbi:hypothetical protein PGT21_013244 [Puccinia graminis f. sp. tritici]|uniref:Uncharacterized protein n=1 Tax=Puccinia graminis f. sp. tritici TaxID=56615 RepID=A0A5B0NC03_PUCGR|nr:hypothetical protein PGT21_013244 [Puccinia graminis f. sp. tritici]